MTNDERRMTKENPKSEPGETLFAISEFKQEK